MEAFKMNNIIKFILLSACFLLFSCASITRIPISPLYLKQPLLDTHKNDVSFDTLFEAWIKPVSQECDYQKQCTIKFTRTDRDAFSNSVWGQEALVDGFTRYCDNADGDFSTRKLSLNHALIKCIDPKGVLVAEVEWRLSGKYQNGTADIKVKLHSHSPENNAETKRMEESFEVRRKANGPAGTIETDFGSFKFLRIGKFNSTYLVDLKIDDSPPRYISLDEVKTMTRMGQSNSYHVKLRNGDVERINVRNILHRKGKTNSASDLEYWRKGVPIVLVDPASGQPFTKTLMSPIKINYIELNGNSMSKAPKTKIISNYKIFTDIQYKEFFAKLVSKANKLSTEADKNGWFYSLPDDKISGKILQDILLRLRNRTGYDDCSGNIKHGFEDAKKLMMCKVAKHDVSLINKGYAIGAKTTPLAYAFLVDKLKHDLSM